MPDDNLIKLVRRTLLEALRASVGTKMFRHVYVRRKSDGKEFDTLNDGELSCAFYVSSILAMFKVIDSAHSVVQTTVERMKQSGWVHIDAPRPGAVAVWPAYDGHEHIGFVLDGDDYISSTYTSGTPQIHKLQLPDGRVPTAYYWHPVLDQD